METDEIELSIKMAAVGEFILDTLLFGAATYFVTVNDRSLQAEVQEFLDLFLVARDEE